MKTKTLLLSLFFAFAVVGLKAQDDAKYDYVFVQYVLNMGEGQDGLYIESADKDVEFIKIEKAEKRITTFVLSFRPVIKYLQSMVNDGWQVVSTDLAAGKYLLRRKK